LIDGVLTEINDGDSVLETASLPALVHGDLHAGNFLLKQQDADWHVTAILDWEWAFTADAAWEFAALDFRRSDADPVGDAFLYGYRERHPVQSDLRSRVHLYRLMLHLEGAVIAQRHFASDPNLRRRHEYVLRRLLRRK
jgi:aminoglycoside phosphotransferase (APT) family kinase protein